MIEELITYLNLYQHAVAILLGMPRLFTIVMLAPFFASAVVTGQLKLVMVGSMYMILHNYVVSTLPAIESLNIVMTLEFIAIMIKEVILGLLIGYLGALLFWAVQSAGFFIDNQRGASQAEGPDISSGESTTPTGSLFFQSITYLFFATGGFLSFLSLIYSTYLIFPPTELFAFNIDISLSLFFAEKLGWLFLNMLLLSAPIAVACLLADVSLGLVNRFASQLNVYVLAMPIKSGLASFLICFYYVIMLALMPQLYEDVNGFVRNLEGLLQR